MQRIEDIGEAARAVIRSRGGPSEPIISGQARAIAGRQPVGVSSDIRSQVRNDLRRPNPVDSDFAAARAEQNARMPPRQTAAPARPVPTAGVTSAPSASSAVQQAGSAGRGIADMPAGGAASDIRSRAPVGAPVQNRVDADFAEARAQQNARFQTPGPSAPAASAPSMAQRARGVISAGQSIQGRDAVRTLLRGTGRVLPAAAAIAGGASIASDIADPNKTKLDVAANAANLTGATAGAAAGGMTFGPVGAVAGGIAGGLGGTINDVIQSSSPRAADAIGGTIDSIVRRFGGEGVDMPTTDPTTPITAEQINQSRARRGLEPIPLRASQPAQAGATQPAQAGATQSAQAPGDSPAQPSASKVLGTFNGREITEADAARLAGNVSVIPSTPVRAPTAQDQAKSIIDGIRSTNAAQDADFSNMVKSGISERRGRADRAEERLGALRDAFDTAIFQGKRRKAAVIADALRTEAGILQGLGAGQVQDTRRQGPTFSPTDVAEAGLREAETAKAGLEAKRAQRIDDLMAQFVTDPESEQGQRAGSLLQSLSGSQQQPRAYTVDFPGGTDEFGEPITARGLVDASGKPIFNPFGQGMPQSSPIVGQARGPDGKLYNIRADGTPEPAE